MRLILASASPRRAELLRAAGFTFEIIATDVDEAMRAGEPAAAYVRRLAAEKSHAGRAGRRDGELVVIGADTAVVVDGEVLGKPADDADGARMLRRLSGRAHEVLTGVSLRRGAFELGRVEQTTVTFARLTDADIEWYVASGEGRDKAGRLRHPGAGVALRPADRRVLLERRRSAGRVRVRAAHRDFRYSTRSNICRSVSCSPKNWS